MVLDAVERLGDEPADVCDITVETQHNYLIAGGVLAHNVGNKNADGGAGLVSLPTDMTFGEVGTEAYAILKNSRSGSYADLGGRGAPSGPIHLHLHLGGQEIAEFVTDWQDIHASRSTSLHLVAGGSY